MKKKYFASHEWVGIQLNSDLKWREFNVPLKTNKKEVIKILESIYGISPVKVNSLVRKGDRKIYSRNPYKKLRKNHKRIRVKIN